MKVEEDVTLWGPRDYVKIPAIPDSWRMCDIGPGRLPHSRANVLIDKHPEILKALDDDRPQIISDLERGLPEIPDGAFDFCWVSHCLEHCLQLQKSIDALNRIASHGIIVVPSVYKDTLFNWEESGHLWNCLPNPNHDGPPIFVEYSRGYINRLKDQMVQKAMCFLYRTGTQHDCTAERHLRAWYQQFEPSLDIVYQWSPEKPLSAIIIR